MATSGIPVVTLLLSYKWDIYLTVIDGWYAVGRFSVINIAGNIQKVQYLSMEVR